MCEKQDLSRAGAREIKSHRGCTKASIMMHVVRKEKVFGWTESRKELERDEVTWGSKGGLLVQLCWL